MEAAQRRAAELSHASDAVSRKLEDQAKLEQQIKDTLAANEAMQREADALNQKLNSSDSDKGRDDKKTAEELNKIINMIYNLNNYERSNKLIEDHLRELELKLLEISEEADSLNIRHQGSRQNLLQTLGKQKNSTTGGLGFLIKHSITHAVLSELRTTVQNALEKKDQPKK